MQLYNLRDLLYNCLDKLYKYGIIVYRKLNNKKEDNRIITIVERRIMQ